MVQRVNVRKGNTKPIREKQSKVPMILAAIGCCVLFSILVISIVGSIIEIKSILPSNENLETVVIEEYTAPDKHIILESNGETKYITTESLPRSAVYSNSHTIHPAIEVVQSDTVIDPTNMVPDYAYTYSGSLLLFSNILNWYKTTGWSTYSTHRTSEYIDMKLNRGNEYQRLFYANGKFKIFQVTDDDSPLQWR